MVNRTIAVPLNSDSTFIMGQREGLQKSAIISWTRLLHTKLTTARTIAIDEQRIVNLTAYVAAQ